MVGDETVQVLFRVPSYQKSEWKDHADRLDMGQSEFIRTMIQAGRRGFETSDDGGYETNPSDPHEGATNPGGEGLETKVQTVLLDEGVMSWDQLVERLAGDFEDRLETALDDLQTHNLIRYSGRDGGYVLADDGE